MINPQPESDLRFNLLVLGSEVISLLSSKKNFTVLEDILIKFLKKDSHRTPTMFMDALVLLFATGLIELEGYKVRLIKNDYTQLSLL